MSKISGFLRGIIPVFFVVLTYGALIYGEIFGIYHSIKKHSSGDVVASIFIPPWAWLRSVEMWWHNDFAHVDWNIRLDNDIRTCIYFINQGASPETNKFEFNEDIEKFSNKIKKYPNERLMFLKNGTREFIEYANSASIDFLNSFSEYSKTNVFIWIESDTSLDLEKKLEEYGLEDDIQFFKKAMNEVCIQLDRELPNKATLMNFNKINDMKSTIILIMEAHRTSYKNSFRNLFNEEL